MILDVQNTIVISADGEAKKLGDYSDNVLLVVLSLIHI